MTEVILAETTITVDVGVGETTAPLIGLTVGETYRIVWDGTEYTDTAVEATLMGYQAIVVGNTALAGGENSGNYPFLLGDVVEIEMGYFIAEDKSAAAHTVAIYTAESSEFAPNDIILKRYSGEEKVFKGVDVVRLTHASNEYTVPYTFGEAVENIPITLDLKDGDQTVTAPEGTLVKSAVISKPVNLTPENIRFGKKIAGVTGEFVGESEPLIVGTSEGAVTLDWSAGDQIITPVTDGKPFSPVTLEKPPTLLPENIAEGIDIAGIIGTFARGAQVVIRSGSITGNGKTSQTIVHNLGVAPDIFFIATNTLTTGNLRYLRFALGIGSALKKLTGVPVATAYATTGKSYLGSATYRDIESNHPTYEDKVLNGANATSIAIGCTHANSTIYMDSASYTWLAIGGLT